MFSLKTKTIALSFSLAFIPAIAVESNESKEKKEKTIFTTKNIIIASVTTAVVASGAYAAYVYHNELTDSFNNASNYMQNNAVTPAQSKILKFSKATQKSFSELLISAKQNWNAFSEKITTMFTTTEVPTDDSEEFSCPGMALEEFSTEERPVNLGRDLGEALRGKFDTLAAAASNLTKEAQKNITKSGEAFHEFFKGLKGSDK